MEGTPANGKNGSNGSGTPNHLPNGHFAKGNTAASGRKGKANWREALRRAVTTEDLELLWKRILKAGLDGDMRAAGLLLTYIAGRPKEVEPEPLEEGAETTPRWEFC